jgi:glucosamine-6-phosphate deaminase
MVQDGLEKTFRAGQLNVYVYESRPKMGQAAAEVIAAELRRAIEERGRAVVILASAPSQNEFLANLADAPDVDWSRVTAFHLDEYLGMDDRRLNRSENF